ncbi:Invasion associated locus B family protein [Methylobacterium sp. 4-46]|uniref:invasion associated locus B family protein n=1 Tax=unclassified Methylobacterium TaxID=2615210 RepID=UPI000152D5D8|nr:MULTISPECIES: invasion associated locus B family protein [Methylobacterium]ACA20579.1 Invasion associated locus B family protein [Methylobacterium sp. 4-46]WFT79744.1 invasion associated locus B family protein [Methylobacterium nodulans]
MFFATRPARPHQAALCLALAGLGLGLATGPVLAQPKKPAPAQPAAPAPAAPAPQGAAPQQTGPQIVTVKSEPSQTEWTKVCGKDQGSNAEVCYTTRDFVSEQGQPVLAAAIYDLKGAQGNVRVARFLLPLGLLLQPGILFSVDQGQSTPGKYAVCFPNGCFAEVAGLKDDLIAALKKGTTLNLTVQNQAQRPVTFAVPLAGFGKAFDGPPIDPKVLEEQQKKLQSELERRSEEMRKQLEAQKGGAPAAAAQPK